MTDMTVELRTEYSTDDPLDAALLAARGDYMSDSLVGIDITTAMEGIEKTKRELCRDLLRKGHFGVFEHCHVYLVCEGVSRVTMAQITRHRHLSFDVQSMRYVGFEDTDIDEDMTIPPSFEALDEQRQREALGALQESTQAYELLTSWDVPTEDARFVLPLATNVNMTVSGNLRAFLHVLDLRHSGTAQWGARELADQIITELEDYCPVIVEEWRNHVKNASLQSP